MYKIIGADGQPYGPVNVEQIRHWIAEHRVKAQTLVQVEGAAEWKPLESIPELAVELRANPASVATPPTFAARASNKIPAGICGILLGSLGIHKFILGYTSSGLIMLLVTLLSCFIFAPIMHIIGLIEGIIYLCKPDEEFVRVYVDGRKEWF
ncbi:MAG TPA: GYF domain-containing protein [Candidatus Saccharimonadales bacterium]|nr:GYF domain-containing protein [Candidatus Saccharimonadales bacterium]